MYLSYVFMFPNLLLAPLPYNNFVDLIIRKEDFTHYNAKPVFINLIKAIIFSLGELFIRPLMDTKIYFSPEWIEMNLFKKLLYSMIVSIVLRFSYFVAFKHE